MEGCTPYIMASVHRLMERGMDRAEVPSYTVFEDYRSSQLVAVVVRWFVLVTWLTLINLDRENSSALLFRDLMGGALVVLNGYVHWRIWKGRPITWPYVLALSLMDLTVITASLMVTNRFESAWFIFYFPALMAAALIFDRRISFTLVAIVVAIYTGMSLALEPGVDTSVVFDGDEDQLVAIVVCMFGVVVAANLMTRIERERRRDTVAAERTRMEENISLQHRAEEAERGVQQERIRISQEIHDGAAQSAYVLSLGLETCLHLAEGDAQRLGDRLKALHNQSRQALRELRYPINLGPLFEGKSLSQILEDHLNNFSTITSVPTVLSVTGTEKELPVVTKQRLFSVAHNSLTNAYKYAQASQVKVTLTYDQSCLGALGQR